MRWSYSYSLLFAILLLTACVNKEAQVFIEQKSTIQEAQKLVEESMKEKGMTVKVGDVFYSRGGKSVDYSRLDVEYKTRHEPIYRGRAYVNVDADPMRLSGINHLGLDSTEGLIPIGPELIEHLKKITHQSMIPQLEQILSTFPNLDWDDENPKIEFGDIAYRQDRLDELLRLYGEDRLADASEADAEKWLARFESPMSQEYAPYIWLTFTYSGEINKVKFEEVLHVLSNDENLPKGPYSIRVIGETFDEAESPINKIYGNGTVYINGPVYIGKFDTTE